jgi:beta-galactosidase
MTEHINMNEEWRYSSHFTEEMLEPDYKDDRMEEIRLPHTNIITPLNYFDEQIYQFISCYRRHFFAPKEWENKFALLKFEAVGHIAKVYLNGTHIITHEGGYTAFEVDLKPHLRLGEDNLIVVVVDSRECNNLPPFGNVIDYLTYGGIYREVSLDIKDAVYIEDAYVITREGVLGRPQEKMESNQINDMAGTRSKLRETYPKEIELWVTLGGEQTELNQSILEHTEREHTVRERTVLEQKGYRLQYTILDLTGKILYQNNSPITQASMKLIFRVEGVQNWDIEEPVLYQLRLELLPADAGGDEIDEKIIRFGFRTCEFRKDGFYLNHHKIKLVGLNRHQSFPYVGYAMPKRQQKRDADLLKYELGVNAVRTSHYPQSKHFLDRCDELGLLVFTEIPGWQYIGDMEWKEKAIHQVSEMVLQYRNHPSIILWGVRINESQDDEEFYASTNKLARTLDPARQTGGVRYLQKSKLLEDVYTYNDFLHNGTNPGLSRKKEVTAESKAPYLVSEFNGHMYPTKAYDDEAHRLEHALRHATVLDSLFEQKDICGGFGWCMFDYNTHKDFGSGDRICYHGVMDMFRNPKLAAYVYASQGEEKEVFELSTSLDIGDHPAGNIRKVYAFTNADSIRLFKNDTFIKEFHPTGMHYGNLPHPPILIDDFIGDLLERDENYSHKTAETMKKILFAVKEFGPNQLPLRYKLKMGWLMLREHLTLEDGTRLYYKYIGSWGGQATSFRFEAVRAGKVVKTITKSPSGKVSLILEVDSTQLSEEETYDVAAIRIRAVDEWGNTLPYYQEPLLLKVAGSLEIIGPEMISLKGGMGGTYVRTKGESGVGTLSISQPELGEFKIDFAVRVTAKM